MLDFTAPIEEIAFVNKGGRPSDKWTPERIEDLRRLAALGYSCGKIALELRAGITRNAVIGKLHRLGLSTGNSRSDNHGPRKGKPKNNRAQRIVARRAKIEELFEAGEVVDLPADQSDFAVSFFKVKDRQCRYPIGDPTDLDTFRFCGAPKAYDCTYCARHFRLTHTRSMHITDAERTRRSNLGRRFGYGKLAQR